MKSPGADVFLITGNNTRATRREDAFEKQRFHFHFFPSAAFKSRWSISSYHSRRLGQQRQIVWRILFDPSLSYLSIIHLMIFFSLSHSCFCIVINSNQSLTAVCFLFVCFSRSAWMDLLTAASSMRPYLSSRTGVQS